MADFFARNQPFVRPGASGFNTDLGDQEPSFRAWVQQNKVPFDPEAAVSDYDMRGFWKALQAGDPRAQSAVNPNDQRMRYPDWWKTPHHETFSNESQWAAPGAPRWNERDQLVTPEGAVVFDERVRSVPEPQQPTTKLREY